MSILTDFDETKTKMCVLIRARLVLQMAEILREGEVPVIDLCICLTCVEPPLESAAILMKFTLDVWMDEKISCAKYF